MRYFTACLLFALFTGCALKPDREIAKNFFLRPYVQQLKESTAPDELNSIKSMAESELVLLHHGYGTAIRNKWIHGNRDPELLRFFHDHGIDHPDGMSMVMIYALWDDLNRSMSPTERAAVEEKRALVARKRSNYEMLESQCETNLASARPEFERCYQMYGLPSANPVNRHPFFKLLVAKSGQVREVVFFNGATPELKQCLQKTIQQFRFSAFADDETVTLYILEFPHCRAAERDSLHNSE